MTIHFVYVRGEGIRCPYAISHRVSDALRRRFDVQFYDWADRTSIVPAAGDILLGHPHPDPSTVFRRSFMQRGWAKRIVMIPFRHRPYYGDIAWWDPLIRGADHLLAICGPYWTDTMHETLTSHWAYKTIQLDLAVERRDFPYVKTHFSPQGRRRFLFIGWNAPYKGFDYFLKIVETNPSLKFGWIGPGEKDVGCPLLEKYGYRDFSDPVNVQLAASYDFMITCGRSDPNPTTILESAAWGLIPVCTPQSGYYNMDWVVNIPLDAVAGASVVLERLNNLDEEELRKYQVRAAERLDEHYNWARFTSQVIECVESDTPPLPVSVRDCAVRIRNVVALAAIDVWTRTWERLMPLRRIWWRVVTRLR